jgi:hypothetical protein
MSDHEFENYLALLSRLLRLSGGNREKIAAEFRTHLEDRLEELLASGMPHEAAVRRALEEFGDAAALAAEFTSLSRNRRRRWLMRLTTFSVAATVLIAAGIAIFWPGRNAGPGAAMVVAQDPNRGKATPADPFGAPGTAPGVDPFGAPPAAGEPADPFAPGGSKNQAKKVVRTPEAVTEAELTKLTNLEFVEMPLKDVIAYLQDQHGVPILLKVKKLEAASVSLDTPVTKNLKGIRLSTALEVMLEELELTYVVKEGLIFITTIADAASTMEIRIYDCRDILAKGVKAVVMPGGEGAGFGGGFAAPAVPGGGYSGEVGFAQAASHDDRAAKLMTIITTNVDLNLWSMNAGYPGAPADEQAWRRRGSISEYDGLVVVTQTAQTHKKIEHLLDMLREAMGLEAPKSGKVVR